MKNKWLLIILGVFLLSCGSTKIVPFDSVDTPKSPDYSKSESWAVLPGQYPTPLSEVVGVQDLKPIDVFFIYPGTTRPCGPDHAASCPRVAPADGAVAP